MGEVTRLVFLRDGTRTDEVSVEKILRSVRTLRKEDFSYFLAFVTSCKCPNAPLVVGLNRLRELGLVKRNGVIDERVRRVMLSSLARDFNYTIRSPYLQK